MMRPIMLAIAACAVAVSPARAEVQKFSTFMRECVRDEITCRVKLRDYVTAADQQKLICLPQDVSISQAVSEAMSWLRHTGDKYDDGPYDDALWAAISTLYPCTPAPGPEPAPAPQPAPDAAPQGGQPSS